MLNKKLMMLTIFFVSLLAVSVVSAAEGNLTDMDGIILEENSPIEFEVVDEQQGEILNSTDDGTFTALQSKIDTAGEGATITLQNDYAYDEGFDATGIKITRQLTIDGGGHELNGLLKCRILDVSGNGVTLKNIKISNANISSFDDPYGGVYVRGADCRIIDSTFTGNLGWWGGAIFSNGDNFNIINSTFTNNSAVYCGLAVDSRGNNFNIINSTFTSHVSINNFASGTLRVAGSNSTVVKCTFSNNRGDFDGGGIYFAGTVCKIFKCTFTDNYVFVGGGICSSGSNCTVLECMFKNNTGRAGGGAIILGGYNDMVLNSVFINNYGEDGGAVEVEGSNSTIHDCIFKDNHGVYGGSIYLRGDNLNLMNNVLTNNTATKIGGALYSRGLNSHITDCIFTNNSAQSHGGAMYFRNENPFIANSIFISNSAVEKGGAINIDQNAIYATVVNSTFVDNNARNGGAIIALTPNCTISSSTFKYNHVEEFGGAVYTDSLPSTVEDCLFTNNTADDCGGAVWVGVHWVNVAYCIFTNNYAANYGGAVFIKDGVYTSELAYSTFKNNRVGICGGAIFHSGRDSRIIYCNSYTKYASRGNDYYRNGSGITLIEYSYKIKVDDVSKYYGGSQRLVIKLTDSSDVALTGKSVKITSNGRTSTVVTDSNGQATFDLNLAVGDHKLICEYLDLRVPALIEVKSTVLASDAVCTYPDTRLTATFLGIDGKALSNRQVTFKIAGRTLTATTNGNGVASADAGLSSGIYNVTAVNPVNGEQKTFALTVSKASSSFALAREGTAIIATLTPSVASGNVIFNFNGTAYPCPISNGRAIFSISGLAEGNYNVYASYAGDANLNASPDQSLSFTITASVVLNDASGTYSNARVIATFYDTQGNPLALRQVSFTVGSTSYAATTNSMGIATADVELGVGIYNMTVVNPVTGYKKSARLTISKVNSTLALTFSQTGNGAVITAALTPGAASGNVIFTFNGTEYPRAISNGEAKLTLSNLDDGTHEAYARYVGDSNIHASADKSLQFTITPSVILNDASGTYSNTNVTATFYDSANCPLISRQVSFNVGGRTYPATTNANGVATAGVDLDVGSYNVTVANPVTGYKKSARLTISKANSVLALTFSQTGNGAVITATVTPNTSSGNVTFSFKGLTYSRPISNGKATLTFNDLGEGSYAVSAGYAGDVNLYASPDKSLPFVISPSLTFNDASGTYLNTKVTATFYDANMNPLASRQVSFNVGGRTYTTTTNANGVASANVDLDVGNYTVTVQNPATGVEKSAKVEISKANSSFILSSAKVNGVLTITATLTPDTATGKVRFHIIGDVFTYEYTINDGKATFEPFNTAEGTYVITVSYDGDKNLKAAPAQNFTFTIKKTYPVLSAKSVSFIYGNNKDMVINLKESDGTPIANKRIDIQVSGFHNRYSAYGFTDKNGQLHLNTKGMMPDEYAVTIKSEGSKTINAKLTINKMTPKLTAKSKKFKKSVKTKKYTATLKTNQNKAMKKVKVTLKIKGKKAITAKTNSKGKVTFKIKTLKKKGKYSATVTYKGNNCYNKVTKKVKITVK